MFKKGQKVAGGQHLSAETKAKVIEMRKAGNKWKDIAVALEVPTKRAMTWAKRKWYKEGMSKDVPIVKKDEDKIDPPAGDEGTPGTGGGKSDPGTGGGKSDPGTGEVGKTKKDAGKIVTKKIEDHIKKSDKAPTRVSKKKGEGKTTDQVDKVAKKGLSVSKSAGMWFLLAIVIAVVVIFVVFLLLKPSKLEKKDYNQPTEKKSPDGLDGRNIDDL